MDSIELLKRQLSSIFKEYALDKAYDYLNPYMKDDIIKEAISIYEQ